MDLKAAATEVLEPLGYEVLELVSSASGRSRRLLLRIDRLDEGIVNMDDVAKASEVFGLELDRLDPFDVPYRLDVESPGSERPLTRARHFERFVDLQVKFRTGGVTRKGKVVSVAGNTVTFDVAGETVVVDVSKLEMARLAEWPDTPR
ncbi:MAG: ribosome maturation factor RimP [Trueperaceae bacterium]|nr:ribosome maturation factor RimP [Trueperaceae bacterium]